MATNSPPTIGFIGLGVMGGPMCRNVALKHPGEVIAFDMQEAAFKVLEGTKPNAPVPSRTLADRPTSCFFPCPAGLRCERSALALKG